jgi:hypothetical protein
MEGFPKKHIPKPERAAADSYISFTEEQQAKLEELAVQAGTSLTSEAMKFLKPGVMRDMIAYANMDPGARESEVYKMGIRTSFREAVSEYEASQKP